AEAAAADAAAKALEEYNAELAKIGTIATPTDNGAKLPRPDLKPVNSIIGSGGQGLDESNNKLREQIAILESARKQYSETSAEYKYLSDQIAFHSTTIANSM